MKDKDLIFEDKIKEFTTGDITVKGFIVSNVRRENRDMVGIDYREDRDGVPVRVMMLFDKATRKIIYKVEQLYGKNSKEINYEKLENNNERK